MRILVTGAARGLGRALVETGLSWGIDVTATVRKEEDLVPAREALPLARWIPLDLREPGDIERAYELDVDEPLDILVNNAGVYDVGGGQYGPGRQSPGALRAEDALEVYLVNAVGPLLLVQRWLPRLRASATPGGGLVVNITSLVGSLNCAVSPGHYFYGPSKAAQNWTTKALARDFEGQIRVVGITPGWLRTRMGGTAAPSDAMEAAAALLKLVQSLPRAASGALLDIDGNPLP